MAVESIGLARAQFSYCAASDKMTGQIVSRNWLFCFLCVRVFFRKLEADFSVVEFQISRERSSTFREEALEKIGLSRSEKLLRVFFGNLASEDHLLT
jgi:hypothetical protein